MDKPHKQVITTHPVAIKFGQSRVHVQNPYPWHSKSEAIQCPKCEQFFIATVGFDTTSLIKTLEAQHEKNQEHPDVIPSEPVWTTIAECTCGL